MFNKYIIGVPILLSVLLFVFTQGASVENYNTGEDDNQESREGRQGFAGNEDDGDDDDSTRAPVNINQIGNGVLGVVTSALTGQFGNAITGGLNLINNRNNAINNLFESVGVTAAPPPTTPKSNVTGNTLRVNGTFNGTSSVNFNSTNLIPTTEDPDEDDDEEYDYPGFNN